MAHEPTDRVDDDRSNGVIEEPLTRWYRCPGGDACPIAVDIGPHDHSLNDDDSVGVLVKRSP